MPTSVGPRRTLQDPWVDLWRGSTSSNSKQAYTSAEGHKHNPTKSDVRRSSVKDGVGSRQRESEQARFLGKYEASLRRALNQRGKPGSQSPAMDEWALALGVDIDHSKATDRARRKVELQEAGHSTEPGRWTPPVPPPTAPYQSVFGNHPRKRGRDALGGSAGSRHSPVVPEVTALDGFLSDLQRRLKSVEAGAVRSSHNTVVPAPTSSIGSKRGQGTGVARLPKRKTAVTGTGGRLDEATALSSASLVDIYGIPRAFVANAEEARRQWGSHHANLEKRDEEFLDHYKRSARMWGVQVSIAKAWRGFIFRRKFLAWKGRRQWSLKLHFRAWCLASKAARLYSGNLKRSAFSFWSEIVEEDRNTRVMGELSFQAAVSSSRLSRQAVVQFFQDHSSYLDDLSPAVLRNKASVKRRILKILFQSWRNAANLKLKAAAQAAFKMCKAVRLHTASAMLWAPEIVSLLFQVWSRMVLYKKAVREGREPPTFLPENGYASLPEWDAWVANKGRHLEMKRRVIHIGGQIFLRKKFRRWVWFAKWSLSQEDRVLEASQHYDATKVTKVFAAWAGVCRDRGSMLRRITRCWQGWSSFTRTRKKAKVLKKKTGEHLRLLRLGSVMNDITAYARDGQVLSAFTVSKLLLTNKCFGGLALSYIATGRVTQLFALLAWQAWKKYTTKRRRWKWLLYEHTRTEALHSKQAVFKAWSYATGRRYRPDAASLTLSASLPFSTWDRFIKNYVDQGVVPAEQLHKDMVDHSVMQQHTAWWLLGQTGTGDDNITASGPGGGEGGYGRPSGRMELPQSGASGSGGLGKLAFPGFLGGKGPAATDWQALTPALFAAVDECDTAAVIDLLHRGAQVNSIYVPPKVSPTGGIDASRKKATVNKQDERSGPTRGHVLESSRALDLPAPALIANQDGTFEMRGTTPLHAAAAHFSADFTPIVIALLHAGACVDALDAEGRMPVQVCTSPQTVALLSVHAARLQQFRFSTQELRWGQQVLTNSRSGVGRPGLWRYVVRAAVVATLDKLRSKLRVQDARAEDAATEAGRRTQLQQLGFSAMTNGEYTSAADVGFDEREKELIKMKMERLDAAKTIVDREHALHSGTAGPPSTSGGGGGGGAGGSAQDMKHLFHDLDKAVTQRASEKEPRGAPPGSGNSPGGNKGRGIGVCANDHARGSKRTGKERTAADHRKAFSARRTAAASWFRAFREDLARADMLSPKAESSTSSTSTGSTAGHVSVAEKVLAIVRDAGSENRCSGARAGRGGGKGGGRLNSAVLGGGAAGGSMLGRGGNTSGTDAFTITEANDCYMALGSVLDQRKRVMDERATRDDALIERGYWVGLQRAMEASKHGQPDVRGTPSSKRRKTTVKKRTSPSQPLSPTTAATDSASGSTLGGASASTPSTGSLRHGCVGLYPEQGEQGKASVELVIDVIPTSSSKRCHSASVALRGTVDNEVLGRAHRTIAAWKEGSEGEGEGSAGRAGPYARLADERGSTFGRGIMSRVPNEWWGQGGGRVLALMLEERRKLRHKGATLTAQAKELEDHLASKSENLQQLYGREHEVGTTVRDIAMETKKSETRFREDMQRWQAKIQQAQRKIRAIAKKRLSIADQTADLENILANWDAREIPTASERAKKTKTKSKEKEEVTPETLRRDIDGKRELMMSLSAKEKQSMETIEKAKVQLEEGRVYLLRMQSILTKYASYNMGKMDTLEKEFQECSRQQGITIDRQKVLGTQLQALFKRLAELDKAISILRPPNLTGLLETARRNSATEDSSSLQGEYDPDSQELLPSTSRRGSKRSSSDTEESGSSKRKRRSGGHQQESAEADTREGRDDNSPRSRMKTLSSSSEGMVGSSRLARATHDHREETMASLLILIDENTAIVDADMCSLASSESVSTASGAKKRSRQAKKHKTAISNKPTTATDASTGGAGTATTSSEMKPKPIAIPPSSVEEGEADSLITPAAWPAEPTPGPSGAQQPPSVSGPSVAAAASLTAATVKASSPKRNRRVQRRGYPSPLKKGSRRKKKLTASPRGGKAKAGKRGNPSGSGTAAVGAEAAEQVGLGQPADTDGRVVDAPVSAPGLEEEKRLADMRAAKEAKELAEEEECRRKWDEEDAEELEAWRARRGTEEELEISPKLSKEDTLRLLTGQYDQALKQMFEPERRAVVAKRIAIVEAEQREKEHKAQDVRPEERTPEDKLSEGRESNPAGNGFFDEQGLDISHLLDDPGLGLTREEIETLFDIVDEGDTEASNGMVSGGAEGGDGAGGGTTVKRRSRLGGRRADRGLILFLRKRGFRRSSMEPLENPIDAFKDSPRPRPAFKPELDDYMMLNFVGGSSGAEDWNETPSATTIGNTPGAHTAESGDGGDGDQINEDEESFKTEESAVWRGRGNNYDEEILSRDVLNKPEPAKANGDNAPLQDGAHNRLDSADRTTDGDDEAHLYPRTLGTSVSVLDEKDAVLRTGGARFAGEDPIRGRLRATDPFLWMGRLNAGTNAISGLIEKATDALKILDGGSGGSDSDTSDGRSSGHQRVDRMQDIQSSHKEVVGPSSRVRGKSTNERVKKRGEPGEKATTQLMGKLGSMTEGLRERDGTENDLEEGNPGEVDRSCASSENVSSSMAYSQSVEENRVIASGVVIKEKDEDGEEDGEREEYDQGNCSKEIETMGQHKGPGAGSGPCPMRASPVNARSAALGSSAKLRSKDTGMGKAKMAAPVDSSSSSGNGQQTFYNSTEEAKTPTGREDWGEDESQDIRFDDIVSGIVRGVATRAPPTPWQPGEAVVVSRTDVMRPPWSAEERVSPTRRQRDGTNPEKKVRKRRRPRSTPVGLRARAEAASTVWDPRPPWSLPLDNVFAPRVQGVMQPNIVTATSPRRRFSEADSQTIGDRGDQQRQGMPPRGRRLVVRGSSALRRPRLVGSSALGAPTGIASTGQLRSALSGSTQGTGRQIGSAPDRSVTQEEDHSADERPQDNRRCHSASEALLESGLLQEASYLDDAPAATDGVWSWGWHVDGGQEQPSTAATRDTFTPLLTPELCKRAGRLGLRGTSPLRKKGKSGDALSNEKPLNSRAPSLLRHSGNHFPVDGSDARGGGGGTRPWTTGELVNSDSSDGTTTAGTSEFLQRKGGIKRQARSADGVTLSAHPKDSSLRSALEGPDDAVDLLGATADGLVGSAEEGVSKSTSNVLGTIGTDGQGESGGNLEEGVGIDGAAVDDTDGENLEFPGVPSQQMRRRVSFADEQGNSDGSEDSADESDGQNQRRGRRESQRRRMSSFIGSSDGYLEGNGSISGQLVDNDGRRKSDLERCRRAIEITKVAHDLLYLDTRPDGLRPITGTPMNDGRSVQGSGGLYVGLAGLRGFDLSFVGVVPTNPSDARQSLGSVAARLAANRRLSAFAAATIDDESSGAGGGRPSSPRTPIASSSKADASWIAQGFLLDRKPGSLMPRLPRSACRAPHEEIDQAHPPKGNSSSSEVNDDGRVDVSRKAADSKYESPLSPVSRSNAQQARKCGTEDENNAAKGASFCSLSPLAKEGSPRTQDARDGREQIGLGGEECARSSPGEGTESEFEGNSEAPPPEVPSGTTAVSCVATAMASLFVPKAAVLWSARDLGVDELVYSAAGDKQVSRPPGSREYTSRALLAAYKKVNPVFEVEASGWSKREGAVAGVDYPLQPPDGWVGANPDFGEGGKDASNVSDSERQKVWKSFERRPFSRAEARALREVRLSRGIRDGAKSSGARSTGFGLPAMRTIIPELSSDGSVSTSRGTTEDNASHISYLSDSTSAMSATTTSLSLQQPSPEATHPRRRGETPTVSTESNTNSNISASSSAGHEEHRRTRSRLGRPSSPSARNTRSQYVREPDSTAHLQREHRRGRNSNPHEKQNRFVVARNQLPSTKTAQGTNTTLYLGPGGDGAKSMPGPSSPGKVAPPSVRDPYHDQYGEAPPERFFARGVRSGGEGLPSSQSNFPLANKKSATHPTPTSLSRLGLSGEADADSVLRAMVRLSSTPSTGTSIATGEKRGSPGHPTSGGAPGKRPAASGSTGNNGTAPAAPARRTLRSAEGGSHGVCRGNTPSIKSGQGKATNAVDSSSLAAQESVLDIEGQLFQSGAGARHDGLVSSRARERFDIARHGGPVEGRHTERSGRKSAPHMGRRRRRTSHYKARVACGGRKVFVLSESQSEPSGHYQRTKQRPLSSNIGGCGGKEHAGGRMSTDSLLQALSSSGLTRQGSILSLTVPSTSGASQQPPFSASNGVLGGQSSDLRSESMVCASAEPRRGTASEFEAVGGSRGRSRRQQQQQQHRPHAMTKAAVHEDPGGAKPLSGSRLSTGKPSEVRVRTERSNLMGNEARMSVDGTDDGDGEGDGDTKTSRNLSEIIAGVTSDAAGFVVPPKMGSKMGSRAAIPLVSAEIGQPLPPAEDAFETSASSSTAAIEPPQRSPTTTATAVTAQSFGGSRAYSHRSNTATTREGKSAAQQIDNGREIEGGARNVRGGGTGGNGSATTTTSSSSRLRGGASPKDKSRPGKSSSHHPRQPMGDTTPGRHGVAETRAAASVTGMGRNAELQATVAPDAGGDQEEVSPAKGDGESPAAGHVVGTVEPHPQVESRENPSGSGNNGKSCSNARRSHDGKGAPSSSRSRDSRERTNRSGGGSPNSQGSGTSRQSSNRGDSKARDSPSPRTRQEIFDKESGSISRKTSHTEEARALEDVSLPRIDKPETITAASGAKQDAWQHRNVAEETYPPAATASPENVFEPQKLPRISSAGGGRSKAAGKHAIKVHSRPARVESKDLQTTTEALTTHHLTVDELLKGGYDELLDDSEDEDDARDRRVTTRKEPLLIPHGARMNGMAYWQRREAKEREQRRRPRSAAHDHTSTGDELGADRASVSGNGNSGGGAEGGNGQWEDEREEIKRLLLAARARREAAVNRVRAQREQARLDSEREILGHIDGSAAVTTTTTPITPAQDGNGSSVGATMAEAPTLANANGRLPAKTFTGAGGPAAAAKSGEATGTVRRAEFFPSTATVGGEVGRRRSDRASGEAPPWKGFTLSVDGEAMLRRGRIPSPERQSPVEGAEDWEYQLIVPGTKDNLVNFSVDTAAVRANYGKLRRRAEIWQRLGLDEEDGDDYASENENENEKEKEKEKENENETKGGHESGNTSTRSASPRHRRNSGAHATGDDAGGNRPNQRRSVFSAERGSFGNPSIDIPEIQIRRRTRVAGQGVRGDESNAAGSTPSNDPGTIAQASRIITELEQNHADLEFPLNALRRDSRGYEDDDYGNEFS